MTRGKNFFQKLLPGGKRGLTGVDIGSHSMKAVELKLCQGQPCIAALGRIPSPPLKEDLQLDEEALANALTHLMERSGINSTDVVTSLSGPRIITRQIKVPFMSDKELIQSIPDEAEKHIPLPFKDLTMRYVKLGQEYEAGKHKIELLLIAVPTALIEQYYHIFMLAGLRITTVDLPAFGLWRLFGASYQGTMAILETGSDHAQLVVVKDGCIKFIRVMPGGGRLVTEAIAGKYGISFEEAERIKEEGGPALDRNLREGLDHLAGEVRRSLEFYRSRDDCTSVDKIILTGGASKLRGLDQYLTKQWGVATEVVTPDCWKTDISGTKGGFLEYDPSFSVALGLVMGEVSRCTG